MRDIYTARLERKILLSAPAQCFHLEFTFDGARPAACAPGQFFSMLAEDSAGKTYTRAYSIASAPRQQDFELCVNRVEGGFFSNLLCDMAEGEMLRCHGPHGLFTLRQPPADGLLIAAGTGIAPLRSFLQWLFPGDGEDPSGGHHYMLVYEAPQPSELFYDGDFQQLADRHANFRYLPVPGSEGGHEQLERAIAEFSADWPAPVRPQESAAQNSTTGEFERYAYVCGLSEMVKAARTQLLTLGWQKRQVLFERYD